MSHTGDPLVALQAAKAETDVFQFPEKADPDCEPRPCAEALRPNTIQLRGALCLYVDVQVFPSLAPQNYSVGIERQRSQPWYLQVSQKGRILPTHPHTTESDKVAESTRWAANKAKLSLNSIAFLSTSTGEWRRSSAGPQHPPGALAQRKADIPAEAAPRPAPNPSGLRARSSGTLRRVEAPVLTWWEVQRSTAERKGPAHPPARPPLEPQPRAAAAPAPLSPPSAAPRRLKPPVRLVTSRWRGRFHPGPTLCDVTMTTERGRERPGSWSRGGRREGPAARERGAGRVGAWRGAAPTSLPLNLLLRSLRRSRRAGPRGAGEAGRAAMLCLRAARPRPGTPPPCSPPPASRPGSPAPACPEPGAQSPEPAPYRPRARPPAATPGRPSSAAGSGPSGAQATLRAR